jgi:hypothetical protein
MQLNEVLFVWCEHHKGACTVIQRTGKTLGEMMVEGRGVYSHYLPLRGEVRGQIYLYIKIANLLPKSSVWLQHQDQSVCVPSEIRSQNWKCQLSKP